MFKSNHNVNSLLDILKVKYPIIQAPMAGGATTKELVGNVSNSGCLGSLGAGYMSPSEIESTINSIKRLTKSPFAVNLFIDNGLSNNNLNIQEAARALQMVSCELDIDIYPVESPYTSNFNEQIEVILSSKVPVFSFTFGKLDSCLIKELHANDTKIIGTATNILEAQVLFESGVDVIVVQGKEAGGHRGTFIGEEEQSLLALEGLIRSIKKEVPLPIIAAGGIMNAKSIIENINYGAAGVQMGSVFLTCHESGIHNIYKQMLINGSRHTCLTKSFSGKLARGIENTFIHRMQNYQSSVLPYPAQNAQTMQIRNKAKVLNNCEFMSLWAGQNYFLCKRAFARELIMELTIDM